MLMSKYLLLKIQMSTDNNLAFCIKCKTKIADIFHDSGDYCLECWQYFTHPDIRSYAMEVDG
jgi:protein-arginine kinase activator protein McsA